MWRRKHERVWGAPPPLDPMMSNSPLPRMLLHGARLHLTEFVMEESVEEDSDEDMVFLEEQEGPTHGRRGGGGAWAGCGHRGRGGVAKARHDDDCNEDESDSARERRSEAEKPRRRRSGTSGRLTIFPRGRRYRSPAEASRMSHACYSCCRPLSRASRMSHERCSRRRPLSIQRTK
jgi:hypothetical protein